VQGPPRENILDLEKIPSPYLSGIFEGKEYHHWVFETARGCPFKCAFCVWTTKGKPRYFSTARAAAEAAWMAARAPLPQKNSTNSSSQTVFLADQDLLMSGARALKIILAMRSSSKGRSLLWVINSNVNFWTPELAAALNSACFEVNLGVESVNPAILKALGRNPPSLARISAGLALLNKFAPEASLRFQLMLGLPGDSRKGFLASLRWALDACAAAQLNPVAAFVAPARMGDLVKYGFGRPLRAAVEVFHVSVFPGSRFEKDAGGLGITWGKEAPYPVLTAKGLTAGDLDACYEALDAIGEVTRRICGQPLVMYRDNRGV